MIDYRLCLLVPHYNHVDQLREFLPKLAELDLAIIVVDDGSSTESKRQLNDLLGLYPQCQLIEYAVNQGKGGAVKTGLKAALELGFSHALQIDADGQHNTDDIARFSEYSEAHPSRIVSGAPLFTDDAPKARVYGRKVTNFWVALETFSLSFRDSLCGYRIYPLTKTNQILLKHSVGSRMDFDTEIMVKAVWEGCQVHFIETKVIYHDNAVSHFNYLQDNLGLIWLHVRLMLGMIWRSPKLLFERLSGKRAVV